MLKYFSVFEVLPNGQLLYVILFDKEDEAESFITQLLSEEIGCKNYTILPHFTKK